MVGRWVENRLLERDDRGRRKYTLEGLLRDEKAEGETETDTSEEGRFRGLKGMVRKVMKIPDSGVW